MSLNTDCSGIDKYDIETPTLIVDLDQLESNIARMAQLGSPSPG